MRASEIRELSEADITARVAELEEERCASRNAIAPHGLSNEARFDPHPLGVTGLSRSTDDFPSG